MIIRTRKREDMVFFDGHILHDRNLSWKAKGMGAYLLGHSDNWTVNRENLINMSADGKHAVQSALKELEDHGYLVRHKHRDPETGQWVWESEMYERPMEAGIRGEHDPEQPMAENQVMATDGFPSTENRSIYVSTSYLEETSEGGSPSASEHSPADVTDSGWQVRKYLEGCGMIYFDADFNRIATAFFDTFSSKDVWEAVQKTASAHVGQVENGKRGITAPGKYIATVLAAMLEADVEQAIHRGPKELDF